LYAVLEHDAAMTGIPSVINTSLNLHRSRWWSSGDAPRCAVSAGLSVAQVGPYLGGSDVDILDRACGLGP
jgi:predicted NodU family carbamoyl transferase